MKRETAWVFIALVTITTTPACGGDDDSGGGSGGSAGSAGSGATGGSGGAGATGGVATGGASGSGATAGASGSGATAGAAGADGGAGDPRCAGICAKEAAASCPGWTEPACLKECNESVAAGKTAGCTAEVDALASCILGSGSYTCDSGGDTDLQGCDSQLSAFMKCAP